MSSPKIIDPEELMLYALQSLSVGEAAEIEAQLEQNAGARRELSEIRGDFAGYALTAEAAEVSGQARVRFLRQIADEPKVAARSPRAVAGVEDGAVSIDSYRAGRQAATPAGPSVVARALPWAGWAVAAGLAFTAGQLYREREGLREAVSGDRSQLAKTTLEATAAREVLSALNDQTSMRVTLTNGGVPASPSGRTTYSAEKGVLIFTASSLAPVNTFKVYELWLIPADGGSPIPAGTFHPDAKGDAHLISTNMPKGVEAKAFGITIEDDGGSKVPTPPILMTGA